MLPAALFGISVVFSFVVWGIVTWQYIWPALRNRRNDADGQSTRAVPQI